MIHVRIKSGYLIKFLRDNAISFRVHGKYGNQISGTFDFEDSEVSIPCPQGAVLQKDVEERLPEILHGKTKTK
jgi:hypothetical protein